MIKNAWNTLTEASRQLFTHKYYLWFVIAINALAGVVNIISGNVSTGFMSLIIAALFGVVAFMKNMIDDLMKMYKDESELNDELMSLNKELFSYIDRLENERAK